MPGKGATQCNALYCIVSLQLFEEQRAALCSEIDTAFRTGDFGVARRKVCFVVDIMRLLWYSHLQDVMRDRLQTLISGKGLKLLPSPEACCCS